MERLFTWDSKGKHVLSILLYASQFPCDFYPDLYWEEGDGKVLPRGTTRLAHGPGQGCSCPSLARQNLRTIVARLQAASTATLCGVCTQPSCGEARGVSTQTQGHVWPHNCPPAPGGVPSFSRWKV